jgi:hypothetical protein
MWASDVLQSALYCEEKEGAKKLYISRPGAELQLLTDTHVPVRQLSYTLSSPTCAAPPLDCKVYELASPRDACQLQWQVLALYTALGLPDFLGSRKAFTDKWAVWQSFLGMCGLPVCHMLKALVPGARRKHTQQEGWQPQHHTMSTAAMVLWLAYLSTPKGFKDLDHRSKAEQLLKLFCQRLAPTDASCYISLDVGAEWAALQEPTKAKAAQLKLVRGMVDIRCIVEQGAQEPSLNVFRPQSFWEIHELLKQCIMQGKQLTWLLAQIVLWLTIFFERSFLTLAAGSGTPEHAAAPSRKKGERWDAEIINEVGLGSTSKGGGRHELLGQLGKFASQNAASWTRKSLLKYWLCCRRLFQGKSHFSISCDASRLGRKGILLAAVMELESGMCAWAPPLAISPRSRMLQVLVQGLWFPVCWCMVEPSMCIYDFDWISYFS